MSIEPPSTIGQVRNLSVSFNGRIALGSLELDIPERGICVLMGRSGTGKTTALRALNRLNEEFPGCTTTGEVLLDLGDGLRDIYNGDAGKLVDIRRRVGMVFQTPALLPLSVRENITLPLRLTAGHPVTELAGRMERALRETTLWNEVADRLDAPATSLSGGQQQRLCIARALALEPRLLLLDEPTASLDLRASRAVEEILKEISRRCPLVLVSHSPEQSARLADKCVILSTTGPAKTYERNALPDKGELALQLVRD